jgi:hypothetical protein
MFLAMAGKVGGERSQGIGITFQTFTYSNVDCRLVIRIRYDSQIRIFMRIAT